MMKTILSISLVISTTLLVASCSAGSKKTDASQEAACNKDIAVATDINEAASQEQTVAQVSPDLMMLNLKGKVASCESDGYRDVLEQGKTVYKFDENGNLISIGSEKINATRNDAGQIQQIQFSETDDLGEEQTTVIKLYYDKNGRVTKTHIKHFMGNAQTSLTYNENGQLIKRMIEGSEPINASSG